MRRFRTNNLQRLGSQISVKIDADESGFLGRECPNTDCQGYFKIVPGTGLTGENLPCNCPYCGHVSQHDHFWTQEQIAYAQSVAVRKITDAFHKDLKGLEFNHKPTGGFGIGVSLRVKQGHRPPIHLYRERNLETEVLCSNCTLRYSVYGVFAFCPDCGQHNSLQILEENLHLVNKMLALSAKVETEPEIAEKLIENALEDCVSAFDGFGRELCSVHADSAVDPDKAHRISFQDLVRARKTLALQFSMDLAEPLSDGDWADTVALFEKRHLFAHRMGVVDQTYIDKTSDPQAVVGRKVYLGASEVARVAEHVRAIARALAAALAG